MKTTDLMIGDWVRTPNGIYRVVCIQDNDVVGTDYNGGEGIDGMFDINDITLIPLTSEILEKNGFKRKKNFMQLGNFDNPPLIMWHLEEEPIIHHSKHELEIHHTKNRIHVAFKCERVHELQHALKLFGIEKEIKP